MSYLTDHLKTCDYCRNEYYRTVSGQKQRQGNGMTKAASSSSNSNNSSKPTIFIKSAASYGKRKKLSELGAIIRGISYPSLEAINSFQTKGASSSSSSFKKGPIEREMKLRELGKMVRGR